MFWEKNKNPSVKFFTHPSYRNKGKEIHYFFFFSFLILLDMNSFGCEPSEVKG